MLRITRTSTTPATDAHLLAALKRQLRIEGDWADQEILERAAEAFETVQERCRKQLYTATIEAKFDCLAETIALPYPPLVSVTSIDYTDAAGGPQTWPASEYDVITDRAPGLVRLAYQKTLPTSSRDVVITYQAGYGSTWSSLPERAKQLIQSVVHHYYHNRDGAPFLDGINHQLTAFTTGDEWTPYHA